MAVPKAELATCLAAVGEFLEKRRPPAEYRHQVDMRVDITGSDVVIVSMRPGFKDKTKTVDHPIAKVKWNNTQKVWQLYWMRADLQWHAYPNLPETSSIRTALAEVDLDPAGCFFG